MNIRTFEYNGVSVEVQALTYRGRLSLAALYAILGVNVGLEASDLHMSEYAARQQFAEIVAYTKKAAGLGFPWMGANAPLETLLIAMNQLFDREDSEALVDRWLQAIDAVNGIGNDTELLPADYYSEARLEALADKRLNFRERFIELFDKEVAREEQERGLLKKGHEPVKDYSDMQRFGLYYNADSEVAFTLRCLNFLEQFEILPEPGGLADQDPKRLDDMLTLKRFREWRRYIYKLGGAEPTDEDLALTID